jgi:hypothetical protein
MRHRAAVLALAALLCLIVAAPGCENLGREPAWGKPTTLLFDLDKDVQFPERPVVLFLCDGLDKATFDRMLAAGELPSIKHYLVDRGVSIDAAVTSLPTVTFAELASYATGKYPGHHGILGNKWFDPRYLVCQNYVTIDSMNIVNDDIQAPTVYEMLDREESLVVLTQINRGATVFHENWMRVGPAWFFKMFRNVSMSTTARLQNAVWRANETKRWPDLITLYYPATDEVGHVYGHGSEKYRELLRVFDNEVGDACKAFEKVGLLDRMLLVMVTDHGLADTSQHFDLAAELGRWGFQVWTEMLNERDGPYRKRFDKLDGYNATVIVDSDRLAKIHFRVPGELSGPDPGWARRPTPTELTAWPGVVDTMGWAHTMAAPSKVSLPAACVTVIPAVDFAAYADRGTTESRVWICGRTGVAMITRRTVEGRKEYAYKVLSYEKLGAVPRPGQDATDPLGYREHPEAGKLVGGAFHTADQWLAATIHTEYPDFVGQLPEMFDHERTGDLVLFAKPVWDFGRVNKSGHGGLSRAETVVPMIFAGADLPKGTRLPYARTVALVPTVVHFIRGEKDPTLFRGFDADSLLDNLRAARENAASVPAKP